jgi:hypothetical protein
MVQSLIPRPEPATWQHAVRGFALGVRSVGKTHPQAFLLVGMRPLKSADALAPVERLHNDGFDMLSAVAAYRLATSFARGFVLAEIQGFTLDGELDPNATGDTHPRGLAASHVTATGSSVLTDGRERPRLRSARYR